MSCVHVMWPSMLLNSEDVMGLGRVEEDEQTYERVRTTGQVKIHREIFIDFLYSEKRISKQRIVSLS